MPYGEYSYSLDEKGRVVIPPAFRPFVADGMVLTRGLEGGLYVFPVSAWERIEGELEKLPLTDADARRFVRFFYMGAHKTRMDKGGRVLIPPTLRQFAGLDDAVIVAGAPGRLEIWAEDRWWQEIRQAMAHPPIPEALRELGL